MINFLFTKTPLYFFTQSFWRDEAFTVLVARKPIVDLLITTAKDFNPPLYYLLVHFWMRFFGSSEISLRTISLIFYWLTMYFCYLFLNNIYKFSAKKSLIYLLFFVCNPLLIAYACEARMYTMLAFFTTLSMYFFLRKNRKSYLLTTILGLYTHYFMVFVVIVQIVWQKLFMSRRILSLNLFKRLINNYFLIGVVFLPWLIFIYFQKGFSSTSFWILPTSFKTILHLPALILTGYEYDYKFYDNNIQNVALVLWLFIFLGIYLFWKKHDKYNQLFYFHLVWGLLLPLCLAVLSFFKPVFLMRYLIFSTIGLTFSLILILNRLKTFFQVVIFLSIILFVVNFMKMNIAAWKKSDYRAIITEIKHLAKKNDVLYVTSELDYFTAQYYFDDKRVFIYGKTYEELPSYVGKVLIPKSAIVTSLPHYPQKAFILTSDLTYVIQSSL